MPSVLRRVGLSGASLAFALVLAEGVARLRGGYALLSSSLTLRRAAVLANPAAAAAGRRELSQAVLEAASRIVLRPGIDLSWFRSDPPDLPHRPVDAGLTARFEEFGRRGVYPPQSYYIWNAELVRAACGSEEAVFRNFPQDVREFATADRSRHPAYRFPANQTLPDGLVTNQFGFRGAPLDLEEGKRLIRIAFVGASTTQNLPQYRWSYPELAGHWLNLWLQSRHRLERVEIINAAREGINSADIREIVRRELLPLHPDYVVYYEGANLMSVPPVQWPDGQAAPHRVEHPTTRAGGGWLSTHSAFVKGLRSVVVRLPSRPLDEPPRLDYRLRLPDPEHVSGAELSGLFGSFIETITTDLEADRQALDEIGARLVVSSVIRLVHDGLRLDPVSQAVTYQQLTTLFQPLTYADIRRLVDLQNAAYRLFAADRGVDFIDVADEFPRDPSLFFDSFHLTEPGVRLHAWLAFLRLTLLLERDMGRLSARPVSSAVAVRAPDVSEARLPSCTPPLGRPHTRELFDLSKIVVARGHVTKSPRGIEIVTEPLLWSYGATLAISLPPNRPGPVWLEVTLKVSEGAIAVGIIETGQGDFFARRPVSDADGLKTITFRIDPDENVTSMVFQTWDRATAGHAEIRAIALVHD